MINTDRTIYGHILFMLELNSLNKEINDVLINGFKLCGYHLGKVFGRLDVNGDRCIVFQFEPRYQGKLTKDETNKLLYHVTTANAAKKIMRQGFVPSNRTKNGFKYDGRCYFFTVYNKELFKRYMEQTNKRNTIAKNKYNDDFEILTVDRDMIKNTDFFTDPNVSKNMAVFTYENIPPTAIVKREKL